MWLWLFVVHFANGCDEETKTVVERTQRLSWFVFARRVFSWCLVRPFLGSQNIVEVYPRPDGTIYICGIGGSDYIPKDALKQGAFREKCEANPTRAEAAMASFRSMSSLYEKEGELDRMQACMRPCPPDALPYMGAIPSYEGAYINAGHNCW